VQSYAGETEIHVTSSARLSVSVDQTKLDNDLLKVLLAHNSLSVCYYKFIKLQPLLFKLTFCQPLLLSYERFAFAAKCHHGEQFVTVVS